MRSRKKKEKKRKEARTIFVEQLHIQLAQLPQLLPVGPEHLVPEHVHLEHLAQHAIHELRPLLREDAFPRPLLPAAGYPVRVLHQLRGGVGQAEEVEAPLGSGVDGGEVLLDPGPGEALDFGIAGPEGGVLVPGRYLALPDVRCEDVGLLVALLGDGFRFPPWAVAALVSRGFCDARHLHHDVNGVA